MQTISMERKFTCGYLVGVSGEGHMYSSLVCVCKATVACQVFCSKNKENSSSFSWKWVQRYIAYWKEGHAHMIRQEIMTKSAIHHTGLKNTASFPDLILLCSKFTIGLIQHNILITIKSVYRVVVH